MAVNDNLITLVIHTEERAVKLKQILESHDIKVVLEDVSLPGVPLGAPVKKVRISIDSLSLGLKILESGDLTASPLSIFKLTGMGKTLLVPVDFSPSSMTSVKVAFFLARKFDVEPVILHSYLAPLFNPSDPYSDSVDPYSDSIAPPEDLDITGAADLRKVAASQLSKFKKKIESAQREGSIPDIRFSTTLLEGIPEQVIKEYCVQNHPVLVVMATRGIHKKESDLVGSVTAEVIDSCRVPVFAVPENYVPGGIDKFRNILMFCNFTNADIVTVRGLMKTFDFPACEVHLAPVSDGPVSGAGRKLEELRDYFSDIYPTATFHAVRMSRSGFDNNMKTVLDERRIDLIIVPNKKSSAFSRFFRPTLAHRILFEKDIPLLVLPV